MKYLELVCVSKEEMACFFHQMSDSRNGVIKKHAGTCITHYALHSLAHFGLVAVSICRSVEVSIHQWRQGKETIRHTRLHAHSSFAEV